MVEKKELKEKREKNEGWFKRNREICLFLGAGLFLVMIFFGSYFLFGSLNKFEYEGLAFTKEKFGDIPVYKHYYYFNSNDQLYRYNLYLRNDPRKNVVPITGRTVDIEFTRENFVYVSLDPEKSLVGCEYAAVGVASLSSFLADNQLNVKAASTDEKQAELNDVEHITCENVHTSDVAIILRSGVETKIIHERINCHIIEINSCESCDTVIKLEAGEVTCLIHRTDTKADTESNTWYRRKRLFGCELPG